jgi:hypothetical protein
MKLKLKGLVKSKEYYGTGLGENGLIMRKFRSNLAVDIWVFSFGSDQGILTCALRVPLLLACDKMRHQRPDAVIMHGIKGIPIMHTPGWIEQK